MAKVLITTGNGKRAVFCECQSKSRGDIQRVWRASERGNHQLTQGRYFDSLNRLEDALTIAKDNFGDESPEFQTCAHKVCETCNLIAMVFLRKGIRTSFRKF